MQACEATWQWHTTCHCTYMYEFRVIVALCTVAYAVATVNYYLGNQHRIGKSGSLLPQEYHGGLSYERLLNASQVAIDIGHPMCSWVEITTFMNYS